MNHKRLFHINVTKQCQLACTHCYISQEIRDTKNHLSPELMKDIANNIGNQHADVHIIGGEPTLVPYDIHQKYIEFLRPLPNATLAIVTALQSQRALKISSLYDNVITSYDPGSRNEVNTHDWLERVKKLPETTQVTLSISLSSSVLNNNLLSILDDVLEMGFEKIHLAPLIPTPNALNDTPLTHVTSEALISVSNWLEGKRKENPHLFITPIDGLIMDSSGYDGLRCPASEESINIMPDGNVTACVTHGGIELLKPNKSSIEDNINSPEYKIEVMSHKRQRHECIDCAHWSTCKGGCNILANSSIMKGSNDCAGFKIFLDFIEQRRSL